MNGCFVKVQITADMIGKEALLPASAEGETFIGKVGWGEFVGGNFRTQEPRNVRQHNLFMACCEAVAENTDDENWNTQSKVLEQIKIALQWYETYVYYFNRKTGREELNIKTKSIGFDNLDQVEAHNFFNNAFPILAAKIGMTEDQLKDAAFPRCKERRICPKCGSPHATHRHHKFPQHEANRAKYGKLIDQPFNIQYYCADCHSSHAQLGAGDTWDELKFVIEAVRAGFSPDDFVPPDEWEKTLRAISDREPEALDEPAFNRAEFTLPKKGSKR